MCDKEPRVSVFLRPMHTADCCRKMSVSFCMWHASIVSEWLKISWNFLTVW